MTFQTFKPAPQKPQEFYNENPVEIEVKGGFHQVGVFLSRLANLSRIVNVTNLQLEGTAQKSRAKSRKGTKVVPRPGVTCTIAVREMVSGLNR